MSKNKKIQRINFFVFFIGWIIIFLLGADFPPPVGFIWVVILVLLLDLAQSYYLDKYFLKWIETHKKIKLFLINMLFYILAGFIVALCTALPFISTIGLTNLILWITVVTIVGTLYGIAFWGFNCLLYRLL